MKLTGARYIIPAAFSSMRKNFWMTTVAVLTVMIALFLCSVFWILVVNVDANATQMESDIEIIAYLSEDISPVTQLQLEQNIPKLSGYLSMTFISKEEGMEQLSQKFSGALEALDGDNPLPDSYSIKAIAPEYVASIAQSVEEMDGVDKVRYGSGSVEQIFSFTSTMREAGVAIMILLGIASIVLIAMSIRISVYSRQKEIMVMKWIGSTDAFIRWPFLLEGIFVGFLGSLLALILAYFTYGQVLDYLTETLPFMIFLSPAQAFSGVGVIMLLAGILMGAIGSSISVARFLDV